MKKILLIASLLFLAAQNGFCGNNLNLQFTDSLVTDNGTCYTGSSYKLYVNIKNEGPDTFRGDIAMRMYVAKKQDIDINAPQFTFVIDSDGTNNYVIPPHGRATYVKDITINRRDFMADTFNVIIIWPSGSAKPSTASVIQDNYIADNFCNGIKVYIDSKSKAKNFQSSNNNSAGNNMNFYPNPSSSSLSVKFNNPQKGEVRITDLNGRMVSRTVVSENNNAAYNINLNCNDKLLPEGIYIITYETADYVETKKFIISR